MRNLALLIFIFIFTSVLAQSNNTVTFSGSPSDFNTAEKIYGGDNVDYYVTYDQSYIYFGAFRVNSSTWGGYDHFTIYVDSDPTSTVTSGGNGSTSGVNWDSNTPTLPFQADYRVAIRTNSSGESFYSSYSGSWTTGGANAQGYTQFATSTALEIRIPWSDLGSPNAIYFLMYASYNGGFFGANDAGYPISFSGSTFSGYFGGIGVSSANLVPISMSNTPITASLSNANPSNGATYGKVEVSDGGTYTAAGNFTLASGGSVILSNGTLEVGNGNTFSLNDATTISQSGTGNFGSNGKLSVTGDIIFDGSSSLNDFDVASGASLDFNGSTTINGNTAFAGSATLTTDAAVSFATASLVGGVDFGTSSTINTSLTINDGGFVDTNPPTYADGSTLIFDPTTNYNVGAADNTWKSGTSGAGVPDNVQVSGSTVTIQSDKTATGNITIDSGCI